MTVLSLTTQHAPSEECLDEHCHWHHVDEPIGHRPYYVICLECAHLYRTKRSMRHAYRRAERKAERFARRTFAEAVHPGRLAHWWRRLTVRADRITFCQFCTHDL